MPQAQTQLPDPEKLLCKTCPYARERHYGTHVLLLYLRMKSYFVYKK